MRTHAWLLALVLVTPAAIGAQTRPGSPANSGVRDPNMARPIDVGTSLWIEAMTWLGVRDAVRAGKTTVIVPTGGIEQNGPYLVTGKHNVILRATSDAIAKKLGNALVAPIVPFVPEGRIDPPSGAMRFAGTISVSDQTFQALLTDIASSLRAHGFREIIFIGDSGGNQDGMKQVAETLSARWASSGGTRVHFIPEYYDWVGRQKWLQERGIHEVDEGIHDEFSADAIMMLVDPATVRMEQRIKANKFTIHGVSLAPAERTIALGRGLVDYIATVTTEAINQRISRCILRSQDSRDALNRSCLGPPIPVIDVTSNSASAGANLKP
jgi:creatinine amidohydrolase/Fe(II)-dependent formamide hydrolase-like protein